MANAAIVLGFFACVILAHGTASGAGEQFAAVGEAHVAAVRKSGQELDDAQDALSTANPIRRVVTLLQNMAKKVAAEGEAEKDLFEKFMCYCKTGAADLQKSIADNNALVPQTQSDIEQAEASKKIAQEALKSHQDGRAKAKEAAETATKMREKEHADFKKHASELHTYINALSKAIPALQKGMSGGFLQTVTANVLRQSTLAAVDLSDYDRDTITAFLAGGSGQEYAPQSGEVVGILQQMKDEFEKDLAGMESTEKGSKENHAELLKALNKEIAAHTEAIESKTALCGELAVKLANMKNSLTEAEAALIEDTKYLKDLQKTCSIKQTEWDARVQARSQELQAIYDTIKILNDDDALDLFKKTLPSTALLQVQNGYDELRLKALGMIRSAGGGPNAHRADLDLLAMALAGKKMDFTKVVKMIDDLLALLAKEQHDDEDKKAYCETSLDEIQDKTKAIQRKIEDLHLTIADKEETLKTVAADIKGLNAAIKALDKSVAEATEMRKKENQEYSQLMSENSAAKEVIEFAKNRLNQFYNPKLYKAPPKRAIAEEALAQESRIATLNFLQVGKHLKGAPGPAPETPSGSYSKKSEGSSGVIAMMDSLLKDLTKEMTEATVEEEEAQKDYEQMMRDSAEKRAASSEAIVEKEKVKGDLEMSLEVDNESKKSASAELMGADRYMSQLHVECDWLLQNFQLRKEARADESEALKNAKAVLSGADYSLVQLHKAA